MTVEPLVDVVTGEVIDVALTAEQARELTDRIRTTLKVGHDLIIEAFRGSAWSALGYASWDAYCAGEFAEARMIRLDREQRREIVTEMRQAGMSTRAVASGLGVSHRTVITDTQAAAPDVDTSAPGDARAYKPVTGVDGKTYTKPSTPGVAASPAAPRATPRKPLGDQFFDAAYDLAKITERIERLTADDRFPQNAQQVAAKHRSDLLRAHEALARVLDLLFDSLHPEDTP